MWVYLIWRINKLGILCNGIELFFFKDKCCEIEVRKGIWFKKSRGKEGRD